MFRAEYDFTKDESLIEQLISAVRKDETSIYKTKTADLILRHDVHGRLFQDVTNKLLENADEEDWAKFVEYAAGRTETSKRKWQYRQLLSDSLSAGASAAMVEAVLTTAKEKNLDVNLELDKQLARFLPKVYAHEQGIDIVNLLTAHGADKDRALALQDRMAEMIEDVLNVQAKEHAHSFEAAQGKLSAAFDDRDKAHATVARLNRAIAIPRSSP